MFASAPDRQAHVPPPPDQNPEVPPSVPPPGDPDHEIDLPPREDPNKIREPNTPPKNDPPERVWRNRPGIAFTAMRRTVVTPYDRISF